MSHAVHESNRDSRGQPFRACATGTPTTDRRNFAPVDLIWKIQMLTLTQAREHLRVDHDAEDMLIVDLIGAAEAAVLAYLGTDTLPNAAPVQAAALLLIGSLYENRETLSERPLHENRLFERLLAPYRVYA
mgnify:CR=1 FL=1